MNNTRDELEDCRYEALKSLVIFLARFFCEDPASFYRGVEGHPPTPQKKLHLRVSMVEDFLKAYDPEDAMNIRDIRTAKKTTAERAKKTTGRVEQYSRYRYELISWFLTYLKQREVYPYRYAVAEELRRFFDPRKHKFRSKVTEVFSIGWGKFQQRKKEDQDSLRYDSLYDIERKIERANQRY